jgi:uncharacterized protein involved in copper resistance
MATGPEIFLSRFVHKASLRTSLTVFKGKSISRVMRSRRRIAAALVLFLVMSALPVGAECRQGHEWSDGDERPASSGAVHDHQRTHRAPPDEHHHRHDASAADRANHRSGTICCRQAPSKAILTSGDSLVVRVGARGRKSHPPLSIHRVDFLGAEHGAPLGRAGPAYVHERNIPPSGRDRRLAFASLLI